MVDLCFRDTLDMEYLIGLVGLLFVGLVVGFGLAGGFSKQIVDEPYYLTRLEVGFTGFHSSDFSVASLGGLKIVGEDNSVCDTIKVSDFNYRFENCFMEKGLDYFIVPFNTKKKGD